MQKTSESQEDAGTTGENNEMSDEELDKVNGGTELGGPSDDQLRRQQQLARRSKAFETLSNVQKKISNTQDTITQNLK